MCTRRSFSPSSAPGNEANAAIVYRGGSEVRRVSEPRRETRLSCLTALDPTTPNGRVAWRVVDKLNLQLRKWFRLVFWQVCKTLFQLALSATNFKLGIGNDWEGPFAGIGFEATAEQDNFILKPRSNLPPKESQSARTSLWIAAWMMLKWLICCWWLAKCWNQSQRRPNLDQARWRWV